MCGRSVCGSVCVSAPLGPVCSRALQPHSPLLPLPEPVLMSLRPGAEPLQPAASALREPSPCPRPPPRLISSADGKAGCRGWPEAPLPARGEVAQVGSRIQTGGEENLALRWRHLECPHTEDRERGAAWRGWVHQGRGSSWGGEGERGEKNDRGVAWPGHNSAGPLNKQVMSAIRMPRYGGFTCRR